MRKMLLILVLISSLVIGLEAFKVPQPMVNATENDPWVWVSLPEDPNIRSVLYYTEYGEDRCPGFDYKFDPDLIHPWAIREYVNETLKISAIVETKQNETFAETVSLRSLGNKVLTERVVGKCHRKIPECEKLRICKKYCLPSISQHKGKPVSCSGRLIFSESFGSTINPLKRWSHVVQSQHPAPHYEGVVFVKDPANSFIKNNRLHLRVTESNYTKANPFYLKDCTLRSDKDCRCGKKKYGPQFVKFIPPFVSAKLRSIDTFKYCRVEIKAKMPIGDLLFPGLTLAYDDGEDNDDGDNAIRIAIVRGNRNLIDQAGTEIGGSRVFAGAIYLRNMKTEVYEEIEYAASDDHFGKHFHTYTVIWKEKSIIFKVDDRPFTTITDKTVVEALSHKERHIELFVTVGGEYNFPDSRIPSQNKYRNLNPSLSLNVKNALNNTKWKQAEMVVKSIKVYSTDEYEE